MQHITQTLSALTLAPDTLPPTSDTEEENRLLRTENQHLKRYITYLLASRNERTQSLPGWIRCH